jgi:hypothetical protein
MWLWVERMNDEYPYFEFGWWGFMPMVIFRGDA